MVLKPGDAPQRSEVADFERCANLATEGGQLVGHRCRGEVELFLQARAGALEVFERGLGGRQRQRVTDEGAGEVGDADGRNAVVTVLPRAAIERIHELALAGDGADRHAAADHLAVGGEVGTDAENRLDPAKVGAEAGDDLVENQAGSCRFGDRTHLAKEVARLEVRPPALHGLDQNRGEISGIGADELERLWRAVVEHANLAEHARQDSWRRRHSTVIAAGTHENLVEGAVVRAGEQNDGVATGDRAGDTHGRHHRLGAGVAQADAVEAGQFADQLRDFAGECMLRADLVTLVELRVKRLVDEIRSPPEQVHAEAVQHVNVFVAVDIPQPRPLAAVDHDLVGDFLGQRTETVDHARIGGVRAMRRGVRLAGFCACPYSGG